jgi:hypothetical protein
LSSSLMRLIWRRRRRYGHLRLAGDNADRAIDLSTARRISFTTSTPCSYHHLQFLS